MDIMIYENTILLYQTKGLYKYIPNLKYNLVGRYRGKRLRQSG